MNGKWIDQLHRGRGRQSGPVLWALLLSLAFHCLLFGLVELGWTDWLMAGSPPLAADNSPKRSEPQMDAVPLQFVEVAPSQASEEAPEEAEYYSAESSRAADAATDSGEQPKIEGEQEQIVKTDLVPEPNLEPNEASAEAREDPQPQASAPSSQESSEPMEAAAAAEASESEGEESPSNSQEGELAMAPADRQSSSSPSPAEAEAEVSESESRPRPRTLREARARQGRIAGSPLRQEGGVEEEGEAALDVQGTSFGEYDEAMVAAIQQHWYNLLRRRNYASDVHGRVVIRFHLHRDGRVTRTEILDSDVGAVFAILCQRAIEAPAPYGEWPSDMARMVGDTHRELRFTFYYN